MHLGSYNSKKGHFDDKFRELTKAEKDLHKKFTPVVIEARNRLSLFRMLVRNYAEWRNYLDLILSAKFKDDGMSEELNRLLLNYLTLAYTIQEHFTVSFRQRFKKDPLTLRKYEEFLEKLCEICWPFAFLLDFRGYVQHVDFGICRCTRNANDNSVRVKVVANAKNLLAASPRQWKISTLSADKGNLDLIAILKEFHIQMFQSYVGFVTKTFFPELQPASEFYAHLTEEVQKRDPNARMIFFTKKPTSTTDENGTISFSMTGLNVPNDVIAELGIKIDRA